MSAITARVRAVGSDMDDLGDPPEGYLWVCIEVAHADSSRCHGEHVVIEPRGAVEAARASLSAAREHEAQARAVTERRTAERDQAIRERDAAARELAAVLAERDAAQARAAYLDSLVTVGVLGEVAAERKAQDAKWGEQNHPSFRPGMFYDDVGGEENARELCEERHAEGTDAYADILTEEYFEVLSTDDSSGMFGGAEHSNDERTRAELVQVAAVAVAWIEAIDRRAGDPT